MKTKEKALAGVGLAIPLGYVIWEATRHKNGAGIAASGNLPLEKTWNAITVATAAPPTGEITNAVVWDRTTNEYHHAVNFPIAIPSGHKVRASTFGKNTANRTLRLQMQVHLFDPAGTLRGYGTVTANVAPGKAITSGFTPTDVPLDRDGTWKIKAVLKEA